MNANEGSQVPSHYASGYMHWDLCLKLGLGYLEAASTKYVVRWREKDGVAGLRKALHYLNKLDENQGRAAEIANRVPPEVACAEVRHFSEANDLNILERAFVERLSTWQTPLDLEEARVVLFQLMDEVPEAEPVPLAEENHYSERAGASDGSTPQR